MGLDMHASHWTSKFVTSNLQTTVQWLALNLQRMLAKLCMLRILITRLPFPFAVWIWGEEYSSFQPFWWSGEQQISVLRMSNRLSQLQPHWVYSSWVSYTILRGTANLPSSYWLSARKPSSGTYICGGSFFYNW